MLACDILLDALMGGNESPIKRAILDAGLGGDATPIFLTRRRSLWRCSSCAMPTTALRGRSWILLNPRFVAWFATAFPRCARGVACADVFLTCANAIRGMADGVPLAMNALAGWLYDEDMSTTYLRYEDALAHMRAGLEGRYFEDVLRIARMQEQP